MYDLDKITEEQYAVLELMNDPLGDCIPKEKYRDYARRAIAFGQEAYEQYQFDNLVEILTDAGVEIVQDERDFAYHGLTYEIWAQIIYGEKIKKIELFMPELRRKCQILKKSGIDVEEKWLIHLHIAHEFYHFLEYTSFGTAGMRLAPVRKKILFRTVQKPITSVSEIAAHSFAGRYMRSDILPQMTDYMVMLSEGILSEEALQKRLAEVKER